MQKILDELWYGNIYPHRICRESGKDAKELMGYIARHHEDLKATLSDEQSKILEKFDSCFAELTDINEREIFTYAFRLGAKIMLDILSSQEL